MSANSFSNQRNTGPIELLDGRQMVIVQLYAGERPNEFCNHGGEVLGRFIATVNCISHRRKYRGILSR